MNWFRHPFVCVAGTLETFKNCVILLLHSTNAGCIPQGPSDQSLPADILLVSSCACESIWCYREGSCSVRGAPCGRPALLEQATLTLPLKSVPAALLTSRAAARPFRFSRISLKTLSLSAIKIFLGKPLSDQKSIGKGQCLTRKN